MKITSAEIARLANVSRSTVSRVINNYSNVPVETREKVMKVIEQYGYEPNQFAQVLAGKANREIVLCISNCDEAKARWKGAMSSYYLRMVGELITQAKDFGYTISAFVVSEPSELSKIENMYLSRTIIGGIFGGFEFEMPAINQLIEKGFNMVVIDPDCHMIEADNVSGIYSENKDAGYMATRYLLELGEEKIAHISGDDRLSSQDRLAGYRKAMEEAGYDENSLMIENGNFDSTQSYAAAIKVLKEGATSIFAANDLMAIAAMRAAADLDLRVPEDIKIVGCDFSAEYREVGYYLTSVEISMYEIAQAALKSVSGIEKGRYICLPKFIKGKTA